MAVYASSNERGGGGKNGVELEQGKVVVDGKMDSSESCFVTISLRMFL